MIGDQVVVTYPAAEVGEVRLLLSVLVVVVDFAVVEEVADHIADVCVWNPSSDVLAIATTACGTVEC